HRSLHSFPTRRSSDLPSILMWRKIRNTPSYLTWASSQSLNWPTFRDLSTITTWLWQKKTSIRNWKLSSVGVDITNTSNLILRTRSEEHTSELQSRENL